MSTEKMRDQFEAWYLNKFCGGQARLFRCVNADQIYYFAEVQSRWDAWQASRAAIEVELPLVLMPVEVDHNYDLPLMQAGAVIASIESLGLKVKG